MTVLPMESDLTELSARLPEFIRSRRWFRAKTRTIQKAEIEETFSIAEDAHVLVVRLEYEGGGSDRYLLDSSVEEKKFRDALLNAIACNRTFPGRAGELASARTSAFPESCSQEGIDSVVSGAEQSNTSIIYGDRFILKLFRKLEAGINPDLEIGTFLTERGFDHTPAALGKLEYRSEDGRVYAAGILQQFVRNRGDAWKYTLDSLAEFFPGALKRDSFAPQLVSYHPMELSWSGISPEVREILGDYADSARLLGQRTAEMHAALADANGGADFAPEPFTAADGQKLCEEMLGQADITFELLRRKQAALTGTAAEDARMLLRMEHSIAERFAKLRDQEIALARIRFHGDYHLGQVLYTGSDFLIIDFEGEPARPLSERRGKTPALRDVAGMIRSFDYAAFAALFGQVPGIPADPQKRTAVESWAAFWSAWISAVYLDGYFSTGGEAAFVPEDLKQRRILLDAFLLQKALYEVAYELNNRPDWVRIPLRGILSLVS